MQIETPYLLFLGDAPDALSAKVARGIADWRPELAVGQLRFPGCAEDLGIDELDVEAAVARGARTLVIGVANRGGKLADAWMPTLVSALEHGLDLASGLHQRLSDRPELATTAKRLGRRLVDVRVPGVEYPIATGEPRAGLRCSTVGTDCSVGKMYASLAIERAMHAKGAPATFRATGQTGILVTGEGVPLDAVVADFMAGAIEMLTPANAPEHWDIVEGQGSLFHPSFSGVTLALLHGAAPDALVLCHEPTRTHMRGLPRYPLPSLERLRDLALDCARTVNADCTVAGVAVNTKALDAAAATALLGSMEDSLGLPCVDPFRDGAARLADALIGIGQARARAAGATPGTS